MVRSNGFRVRPGETVVPPGFELEELNNYKYADWAIGDFITKARTSAYFDDTLFVFAADHGVHLRGHELIPYQGYRVPVLFLAPKWLPVGRVDRVTSQIDVAPSILHLLGKGQTPFFGSDVFVPDGEGFAPLIYQKEHYGVLSGSRVSMVGPEVLLTYERQAGSLRAVATTDAHRADARKLTAVVQVAERLLRERRYVAQ